MPTAEVCRRHGISSCDLLQVEVEVWRARGVCCARLRLRTPGGCASWSRSTSGSRSCWRTRCSPTPCSRRSTQESSDAQCQAAGGGSHPGSFRGEPQTLIGAVPVRCWALTGPWCATSVVGLSMPRRENASGNWPASDGGLAIGGCTGCCAGRDGQ